MTERPITGGTGAARLRPLTAEDIPAAQALTAALRWPHRVEDWSFGLALGQGLAAELIAGALPLDAARALARQGAAALGPSA